MNDEIINFYVLLVQTRAECEGRLKIFCFNSFFWEKLRREGYKKGKLATWTKKVGVRLAKF